MAPRRPSQTQSGSLSLRTGSSNPRHPHDVPRILMMFPEVSGVRVHSPKEDPDPHTHPHFQRDLGHSSLLRLLSEGVTSVPLPTFPLGVSVRRALCHRKSPVPVLLFVHSVVSRREVRTFLALRLSRTAGRVPYSVTFGVPDTTIRSAVRLEGRW